MTTTLPAGWKPISSAPKDGTEILAWRSDCGQFIASYTSADSFPMTQDEIDAYDEATLFAKDWFTQWPDATRLEGSEVPTLWQPLPVEPCPTCNDQGAVGNILNAEPCPDCTPPAATQDDTLARTGNTADHQDGWFAGVDHGRAEARAGAQDDAKAVAWMDPETLDVISAERKASWLAEYGAGGAAKAASYTRALGDVSAPAAGDARDAARYRAWRDAMMADDTEFRQAIAAALPSDVGDTRPPTGAEWDAAIDAAIAAQQGKGGAA